MLIHTTNLLLVIGVALFAATLAQGQPVADAKKMLRVSRRLPVPAAKAWQALARDYGAIGNFSPKIYASSYENGSVEGREGAERRCEFNAKGTQWLHERIAFLDHEQMVLKNTILQAGRFPVNTAASYGFYRVEDHGDGTCTVTIEGRVKAKPAIMTFMMKGAFKKLLNDTLIGLEHYLTTGEVVNATTGNWKTIRRKYAQ